MSTPHSPLPFWSWSLCALGLASAAIGAACSPGKGTASTQFGTEGAGGGGAGMSGPSGSGGNLFTSGTGPSSGTMGAGGFDSDAGCAGEATKAQELPLDMYVMLDQSGSMTDMVQGGGDKWMAVTSAIQAFVTQPGLEGISIGIQYFGLPPGGGGPACNAATCMQDSDCGPAACGPCQVIIPGFLGLCSGGMGGGGGDSCNAADYAKPEVEITALPGVAPVIISSMAAHMPGTSTPTQPALQGAIDHSQAWAMTHPGHVAVAVLATDGAPTECQVEDAAGLGQIAAAGLAGSPSVKTFTIGIFAPGDIPSGPDVLNAISAGGGTGQSFTIQTMNQNVNQQFLMALNAIRGSVLGCQYSIPVPSMGMPDYTKVNVEYTPGGGGAPEAFPKYQDQAACPANGDGWYYDNNNTPMEILLCPSSCNKVSGDSTGTVDVVLGCLSKLPG